jgi:hypothetical protein
MDYIMMLRTVGNGGKAARRSNPSVVVRTAPNAREWGCIVVADGSPWNAHSDPRFHEAVLADDWEVVP